MKIEEHHQWLCEIWKLASLAYFVSFSLPSERWPKNLKHRINRFGLLEYFTQWAERVF